MKMLNNRSDEELIRSITLGDEQSFAILYRRHYSFLYRHVLNCVRDQMAAEDLVQDAFIRIYTSLKAGRYAEEGKFTYWAQRVVNNICMDYLRKPNRVYYSGSLLLEDVKGGQAPSPEDLMITRQLHAQVRMLVNQLPDNLKQVVYYRHYEEISFKEISHRMGASLNTSLGRMRYSLMHLRNRLKA